MALCGREEVKGGNMCSLSKLQIDAMFIRRVHFSKDLADLDR